jgi:endothelin-converting enzyme/putative endopeptidase
MGSGLVSFGPRTNKSGTVIPLPEPSDAAPAWKAANKGKVLQPIDGFTPEQRFFIGMAQWACGSERPESLRVSAVTDPHSPPEYRVNGVVSNMPEFRTAFSCKIGQPMVRDKSCKVW